MTFFYPSTTLTGRRFRQSPKSIHFQKAYELQIKKVFTKMKLLRFSE